MFQHSRLFAIQGEFPVDDGTLSVHCDQDEMYIKFVKTWKPIVAEAYSANSTRTIPKTVIQLEELSSDPHSNRNIYFQERPKPVNAGSLPAARFLPEAMVQSYYDEYKSMKANKREVELKKVVEAYRPVIDSYVQVFRDTQTTRNTIVTFDSSIGTSGQLPEA